MTSPFRILAVVLLLLIAGSASAQEDDAERLRIHGSNLLGSRLVPTLVESWLREIGYAQIKRREVGSDRTEIGGVRDGEALVVEIDKRGTASGLQAIINGDAEICMSARQPNAAELDDAWQLGDLKSPTQEWVVGLDGLVVLVSPDNPLFAMSVQQLRDVVCGEDRQLEATRRREWQDLGAHLARGLRNPGGDLAHAFDWKAGSVGVGAPPQLRRSRRSRAGRSRQHRHRQPEGAPR